MFQCDCLLRGRQRLGEYPAGRSGLEPWNPASPSNARSIDFRFWPLNCGKIKFLLFEAAQAVVTVPAPAPGISPHLVSTEPHPQPLVPVYTSSPAGTGVGSGACPHLSSPPNRLPRATPGTPGWGRGLRPRLPSPPLQSSCCVNLRLQLPNSTNAFWI